ncbi:alpha/beta hydrolase [Blastococcus sp. SYSU DS1024]
MSTRTAIDRPVHGAARLPDRPGWRALRADPTGLVVATLFALQAMTPSLLPRSWLFQGIVSGLSAAIGYGFGVLLAWLVRRTSLYRRAAGWAAGSIPDRVRRGLWAALLVGIPVVLLVVLVIAADWQREARALVQLPPQSSAGWLRAAPVLVVLAVLLVAAARGLRWLARRVARQLRRWVPVPPRVALAAGAVLVTFLTAGIIDGVVLRWALNTADATFSVSNEQTPAGVTQPVLDERSGSPSSLSPWDSLGHYGQAFVAGGPSRDRMARASGLPEDAVRTPIRAYVGLDGAEDFDEQAALAVAELERTGAFDRAALLVVTTTGTGWVDQAAPEALELMYGGDVATVATQYSYLPSWISFLVDRGRAQEAGRSLFDAVHARWEQEPENRRPRLLVYGESLGSLGSEAAFDGLNDIRERTDGVLWTGPPNSNRLWSQLVERRDPGTPEVAPVYAGGLVVRFADAPENLLEPDGPWLEPRVAYLMHPTDPVVWWSPDLLFSRPDWLVEPRGAGVNPAMSWYPVVTFWQVSADLTNAASPPMGYGHNYAGQLLDAWAIVAPPPGWTGTDTERARRVFLD